MGHLLDRCIFAASIWDKGDLHFIRSDRRRGFPAQTLKEWHPKAFKNRIIRSLWEDFYGMVKWCIWKERNGRIFRDRRKNVDEVWTILQDNLLSLIRSNEEWNEIWKKIWVTNLWPKVATFSWLVAKVRILTDENLKK